MAARADAMLEYRFLVTNTGNVTLTNVKIADHMVGLAPQASLTIGTLAPGATTVTASYVLTQADIDRGTLVNTASASGEFLPLGATEPLEVVSPQVTAEVNFEPELSLSLKKTASFAGAELQPGQLIEAQVGAAVTYEFVATNLSNVTLRNVKIADPMPGLTRDPSWTIGTLAPGETTVTATYRVTQADIDRGELVNDATATGEFQRPGASAPDQTNQAEATVTVKLTQNPSMSLVKSAWFNGAQVDPNTPLVTAVGDALEYRFLVRNTGNVTLTNISIDDPVVGLAKGTPAIDSLSPGEPSDPATWREVTASLLITADDLDATEIINTATAHGFGPQRAGDPAAPAVESNPSTATVDLGYPAIELAISVLRTVDADDNGLIGPGDQVVWKFDVTNTGTLPLENVSIDPSSLNLPLDLVCQPITLAAGQSATLVCEGAVWTVTDEDAVKGSVVLSGTAEGTAGSTTVSDSAQADAVTASPLTRPIVLEKLANVETAMLGDVISFTIRISHQAEAGCQSRRVFWTRCRQVLSTARGRRVWMGQGRSDVSGRRLTLDPVQIEPGTEHLLSMEDLVGASVKAGAYTNQVELLSRTTGQPIADPAYATVEVLADAVFQCATVLGRVFDDRDQNGQMSEAQDEAGLPKLRLIAPNGMVVQTDAFGRFNVPCAALPQSFGSNFMLKLDERSLPSGYRLTTENPRVVRLTPGMITRLDFGATLAPLVWIDLSAAAFVKGEFSPELKAGLAALVQDIRTRPSMLA